MITSTHRENKFFFKVSKIFKRFLEIFAQKFFSEIRKSLWIYYIFIFIIYL